MSLLTELKSVCVIAAINIALLPELKVFNTQLDITMELPDDYTPRFSLRCFCNYGSVIFASRSRARAQKLRHRLYFIPDPNAAGARSRRRPRPGDPGGKIH